MTEPKSKTQKKHEVALLTDFARKLLDLSSHDLKKLPISPLLTDAITQIRTFKSHGAIRRQLLWISKLIRKEGEEAIQEAFQALQEEIRIHPQQLQCIEIWRTELLSDNPDALTDFIKAYPHTHAQSLRHHIQKVKKNTDHAHAYRALFKYLQTVITSCSPY